MTSTLSSGFSLTGTSFWLIKAFYKKFHWPIPSRPPWNDFLLLLSSFSSSIKKKYDPPCQINFLLLTTELSIRRGFQKEVYCRTLKLRYLIFCIFASVKNTLLTKLFRLHLLFFSLFCLQCFTSIVFRLVLVKRFYTNQHTIFWQNKTIRSIVNILYGLDCRIDWKYGNNPMPMLCT